MSHEDEDGGPEYLGIDTMDSGDVPLPAPKAATAPTMDSGTGVADSEAKPAPRPGTVIANRYRLVEELGRGGMGSVFRAEHVQTGGFVAVKLLHSDANSVRFELEARNAAALSHPNTVRIIDYGDDAGLRYLVMEFLQGRALSDLFAEGPLPWERVIRITTQVLKALWEAHDLGIVHRDIKPANILVTSQAGTEDFVKVVDFGISRALDTSGADTQGVVGSPLVMAPEQWNEDAITPQTDLYALGCTVYMLLAGRAPFLADTVGALALEHVCGTPDRLERLVSEDTPTALVDWVERALEKDPDRRHPSARHALEALEPLLTMGLQTSESRRTESAEALPDRPYRHLEPFTRAHTPVFFGRSRKVRQLHAAVTDEGGPPIVLLYGPSGVGKSSLLDAGLQPRLVGTHDVLYARRNPKVGLLPQLEEFLEVKQGRLRTAWLNLEAESGRPLVIILDQVEEVYTQPGPDGADEFPRFIEALQRTFALRSGRPRGRLVLSFRKEWLAELEQILGSAGLAFTRFGVASLNRQEVLEVIRGPTSTAQLRKAYQLDFEDGLPERIADILLRDHHSALAPTLQVLLTKLWETTAPTWNEAADAYVRRFTHAALDALVEEGLFLADFVDAKLSELEAWKPDVVQSGLLLDVLVQHTTAAGTAKSITGETLTNAYPHMTDTLPELMQRCKDAYLLAGDLRSTGTHLAGASRLAHDTLAPLVRQRFEDSNLPGQRAARILQARALDWRDGQVAEPLDPHDLALVERGSNGTRAWTDDHRRLIDASRERRERVERGRRLLRALAIVVGLVIAGLGAYAWQQSGEATDAAREADDAKELAVKREQETREVLAVSQTANMVAKYYSEREGAQRLPLALLAVQAYRRHVERPLANTSQLYQALLESANPDNLPRAVPAHPEGVGPVAFIGEDHVVTTGADSKVKLWALGRWDAPVASHKLPSMPTCLSANTKGQVVVGTRDGAIYLFAKGFALREPRLLGKVELVADVDISTDGTRVVAASHPKPSYALVWQVDSDAEPRRFALARQAYSVRLSPDGTLMVVGSRARTAMFDLSTGKRTQVRVDHNEPIRQIHFTADGKHVATAGAEGRIQFRQTADLAQYRTYGVPGSMNRLHGFDMSADGRVLVAGYEDGRVQLWDPDAPRGEPRLLGRPQFASYHLQVSPSGRWVAEAGNDGNLRLWDLNRRDDTRLVGFMHPSDVSMMHDGSTLIAGSFGHVYRVARDRRSFQSYIDKMFEPEPALPTDSPGRKFAKQYVKMLNEAMVVDDFYMRRWFDPNKDLKAHETNQILGQLSQVYAPLRFVGQGRQAEDKVAEFLMDAAGKRVLFVVKWITLENGEHRMTRIVFNSAAGEDYCIAYSPGDRIATGGLDGIVRVYDGSQSDPRPRRLKGHAKKPVTAVAFSNDGNRMASGTEHGEVLLWDLAAPNTPPRRLAMRAMQIHELSFRAGDGELAAAVADGELVVWDLATGDGKPKHVVKQKEPSASVGYSADGKKLVVASGKMLTLRDADDPTRVLQTLSGHLDLVIDARFTADGNTIASASLDGTIRVWDLTRPEQPPEVMAGHEREMVGLAIDPKTQRPITAAKGHPGEMRWWPSMATLADRVCANAWRNMTLDEWHALVGADIPYAKTCPKLPVPETKAP